jgi:hypothetical protein
VVLVALLAACSSPSFAQVRTGDMPENASSNRDGSGWTCDRGYGAADTACIALQVPENAHLDYSGNDWNCNQPYLKRAGDCAQR